MRITDYSRRSRRPGRTVPRSGASAFEQYLLAEYEHIADAHFKMVDTISTFFKHYLVIMAIPISVLGLFLTGGLTTDQPIKIVLSLDPLLPGVFLAVAVAGLGVLLYIVNLRLDAMLYARTINGIRMYFYDRATIDIDRRLRMRVLPQSPQLPSYREIRYFMPVVVVFAIIDTAYVLLGLWLLGLGQWSQVAWAAIFFVVHFGFYAYLASYREHQYLRSNIIGVDIDGVLNQHRQQFSELLEKHTGNKIDPRWITTIPVRDCEGLDVTKEDEIEVFNDPDYWISMPVASGAQENLESIRKAFNMKVYIFTWRHWPYAKEMDDRRRNELVTDWREAVSSFHRDERIAPFYYNDNDLIKDITELWLHKHRFEYDWLMIERGRDEVSDPRAQIDNRFYKSRKMRIRFFVEDDAGKATKLAYICDAVFLLEQPYNRNVSELPTNVIRVKSWDEIYKWIKVLS